MIDEEVRLQVKESIANAVAVGVKDESGDDAYVHATIAITLVELPRKEDDGPETENMFLQIMQTSALPFQVWMTMLEEAATILRMQVQPDE
ncbi:hypothetical protein SEA_CHEWYVIII_29 [Rhodococcus phage ChewyVIII]|uniref:Uncharacterized protein n=1 Tax=Rhodococcus phage ChewyVIII TaxID=1887657 RepID=A0A1C9EI43_9CAUD|nr:hypothetical protein QEH30_gp29 [Rhodococcus phage ChewyVIII]AON97451.1 hypothetical protein SEA_CHEWYVIII_29 [Rhodococcus phage ChewyVIII]